MDKTALDALTFLSTFQDGVSRYLWDRLLTYGLKYKRHPGEFMQGFISAGFVQSTGDSSLYVLTPLGQKKVQENLDDLKVILGKVKSVVDECMLEYKTIKITDRIVFYGIQYFERNISIYIFREAFSETIVCDFPSETGHKLNSILLSFDMVLKTDILIELIKCHLNYLRLMVLSDDQK
jgi:hypothetical protein